MSRTDKDRPYRIREYEDGLIKHDHSRGECIIETQRDALTPFRRKWNRHKREICAHYEWVTEPCKGALLRETRNERTPWGTIRHYRKDTCSRALNNLVYTVDSYNEALRDNDFRFYDEKTINRFFSRYVNDKRFYCSEPHSHLEYFADRACTCDDDPPVPTCTYTMRDRYYWMHGSAPHEYRQPYRSYERRVERDALNDARRDWNANGDTEIEPVSKYHRHCANWYYW